MTHLENPSGKRHAGAVTIRLRGTSGHGRAQDQSPGASDEEMLEEITLRLSRKDPRRQPAKDAREKADKRSSESGTSTRRVLAQLTLLAFSVLIGIKFGALAALAFLLFVCLPIATLHWTADPAT